MADSKHIDILIQGVTAWDQWRRENPGVRPRLAGEDLSEMDLSGVNLAEADLADADLFESNLSEANLKMADLSRADLSGAKLAGAGLYKAVLNHACLIGADLTGASLAEAVLESADLRSATLCRADFTGANLSSAELVEADLSAAILLRAAVIGTDLRNANLAASNLTGLRHGPFRSKRGRYFGIRGLDSCFGNALFVRDAKDQDYLDTLESSIDDVPSPAMRRWQRFWFSAWGLIDYGRSLAKAVLYAMAIAMAFGAVYALDGVFGWELIDYPTTAGSLISPFYFSIVTYTKIGFGGITPTHWIGEVLLICERLLGYITLGLLLSILANRVARRS